MNSFILGGEQYSLPTTMKKLRDFVVALPSLVDQHPRPVRIAVTPYSAITTGGGFGVFHNASTLRQLIYSHFAAREARDRISSILGDLRNNDKVELIFLHDEVELFRKAQVTNQLMLELQEMMLTCRSILAGSNSELSVQVDRKDVGQIYRALEGLSRNVPMGEGQISYRIFGGSAPTITADDGRSLPWPSAFRETGHNEMCSWHWKLTSFLLHQSRLPLRPSRTPGSQWRNFGRTSKSWQGTK